MHSPSVLLRDMRNMKKNNTLLLSMTSKDIGSTKDLKKARSSEQLINLKGFLDNKNDKIKTIDQKLEVHQTQIQRNGAIIQELTNTLMALKSQFVLERDKVETQEKKNKQLRQQIQRTNKLLKSKNLRIDELTKRIETTEKQIDMLKPYQLKVEELIKTNNQLRKQTSKLQENLNDKKGTLSDQLKQLQRLKEKIAQLGNLKFENERLKIQNKEKDMEIEKLNSLTKIYENQNINVRFKSDESLRKLNEQVTIFREKIKQKEVFLNDSRKNEKKLQEKILLMESEQKRLKLEMTEKQNTSQNLNKQVKQLRQKLESSNLTISKSQEEQKNHSLKLSAMKYKIEQLQKKVDSYQAQKVYRRTCEEKLENLNKKSKRLEELYRLMLPQIQCPYGHELKNPITVIPCGHNYCLECKKGYSKECMLCNGKLKIEAVYRNELMDDIINIVTGIKQILEMIK